VQQNVARRPFGKRRESVDFSAAQTFVKRVVSVRTAHCFVYVRSQPGLRHLLRGIVCSLFAAGQPLLGTMPAPSLIVTS